MATCDSSTAAAKPVASKVEHPRSSGEGAAVQPPAFAEQLKIVIVGHVDHGKSTLVGRLLHESGTLAEGKLQELQRIAERRGVPFEWANLMDSLQAERDQNITIDTAQIWFHTSKRQYVIIDAPGHKEFLKNMVTGAAHAEAAFLLIDAAEGVQEQSRRHGYLLNLLGVRQIVVLVNKMDLVNYSHERFESVRTEFVDYLKGIGLEPKLFIPIVAKNGDNIAAVSSAMPWWTGPTVLQCLDDLATSAGLADKPLRFPIQDIYRFDERRILAGRVEAGDLKVGDKLIFTPGNKTSTVKTIEAWNAPAATSAGYGQSVGITLSEQIFVSRGAIASLEQEPPYELSRFKARMFWLGRSPFRKGASYRLKLATQEVDCEIDFVEKIIDASSLQTISRDEDVFVGRHEVAELTLHTKRPVAFDAHAEIATTGRFVIMDKYEVSGGGIILQDNYPRRTPDHLQKSHNIYWSYGKVTSPMRERQHGHQGCVIWLTGLSASGKSTIATELERQLFALGRHVYLLDGDNMRHGLCSDLGFSPEDRKENIRRIGEVARLFSDAGLICITAFISPYRSDRTMVRKMNHDGKFFEVFVDAPLQVCESRDPKGLYAKARAKEIKEFTGVSAPYEAPDKPELILHTDQISCDEAVAKVLDLLHQRIFKVPLAD
jgi:bifunctional enzyme CysN/CysC